MSDLVARGDILWADLDPTKGREQAGCRPVLVVSSDGYNITVPQILIVLPITTRDRGLPHHVRCDGDGSGLRRASFAMTEQPRTIDRERIAGSAGRAGAQTMSLIDRYLQDFLALG